MDTKGRLKNIWHLMRHRCYIEKDSGFKNYGGRGVTVCDEWHDFKNFHKWAITHGYEYGLSIDRIDNDGSYSPDNCRWATVKEQSRNRRTNVNITYNGVTKTLGEWAESIGVTLPCLHRRFFCGWSVERALNTPVGKRHFITYNGKTQRLCDWAKELDLDYDYIENRINRCGWSAERAFTEPKRTWPSTVNNPTTPNKL